MPIGVIVSTGEQNTASSNKLYMENFSLLDNDLQLITNGVAFSSTQGQQFDNKKKYIAEYESLTLSNDIALTSSTTDYNGTASNIDCMYGGLAITVRTSNKTINFTNLTTMELNSITCDHIYDDVTSVSTDFYEAYPFNFDGVNYIGIFYVVNNQIRLLYRDVNSTTTTAMFESKSGVSTSITAGRYRIYQDEVTKKLYLLSSGKFYEYNWENNTYTLVKTLPTSLPSGTYNSSSASNLHYIIHNSIIYLATDKAYVLTIGINTGATWSTLCNAPNPYTYSNTSTRIGYVNNMFILAYESSSTLNKYKLCTFDVNGVLTNYTSCDYLINIVTMVEPEACVACYTQSDSPYNKLTRIFFTKIYNLTKNGIDTKCLLKEGNTEEI